MTEILSLSKARKERARAEDKRRAEENRAKFGRTRSERETVAMIDRIDQRRLDSHRREESPAPPRSEDDASRG